MGEQYWRCRFWPRCAVHRGLQVPRHFSEENAIEMRQLRREGARVALIAELFDTTVASVSSIIRRPTRSEA